LKEVAWQLATPGCAMGDSDWIKATEEGLATFSFSLFLSSGSVTFVFN
jgi:hypothetical protein